MPDAVQTQSVLAEPRPRSDWTTLNTDGRRHPVLNTAAVGVLVLGVVGFVLGLIVKTHAVATVIGIIAFGGGMIAQLNSATRNQRILIITGVIGGFVGMGLGIGHGGFA